MKDYTTQTVPDLTLTNDNQDKKEVEDIRAVLMQNLSQMPVGVDELSRACHISVNAMQMALLEMELAGCLQRLPGNRVALIDE